MLQGWGHPESPLKADCGALTLDMTFLSNIVVKHLLLLERKQVLSGE